jgi:hypothetical protein
LSLEFVRDWGPLLFTAFGNLVLAWLGMRFAGKREVIEAKQAALDAHHRIDLIEKDLKGVPGYDVTNEIKEEIAGMREKQAATMTEVHLAREQLNRIDEFLRGERAR